MLGPTFPLGSPSSSVPSLGEVFGLALQLKVAMSRAAELEHLRTEATQYLADMTQQEEAMKATVAHLQAQLDKAQAVRNSAKRGWI